MPYALHLTPYTYSLLLSLAHIRNHAKLSLVLSGDRTIIVWPNGGGKTNCLLAIRACLNGAVSSQVKWEHMLMKWEAYAHIGFEAWAYTGKVMFSAEKTTPKFTIGEKGMWRKKYIETHGWRCIFIDSLTLNILYLTPTLRRHFMDGVIDAANPGYAKQLKDFKHLMTQRNHLLKRVREGISKESELEYWDKEYAKKAYEIWKARLGFMSEIFKAPFQNLHDQWEVYGYYKSRYAPDMTIEDILWEVQQRHRQDIASWRSTYGPQLDDFCMSDEEVSDDMTTSIESLSRGQNKMLLLEIMHRSVSYVKSSQSGVKIMLLLDDIFSELDEEHISSVLMSEMADKMVMTTQPNHMPKSIQSQDMNTIILP